MKKIGFAGLKLQWNQPRILDLYLPMQSGMANLAANIGYAAYGALPKKSDRTANDIAQQAIAELNAREEAPDNETPAAKIKREQEIKGLKHIIKYQICMADNTNFLTILTGLNKTHPELAKEICQEYMGLNQENSTSQYLTMQYDRDTDAERRLKLEHIASIMGAQAPLVNQANTLKEQVILVATCRENEAFKELENTLTSKFTAVKNKLRFREDDIQGHMKAWLASIPAAHSNAKTAVLQDLICRSKNTQSFVAAIEAAKKALGLVDPADKKFVEDCVKKYVGLQADSPEFETKPKNFEVARVTYQKALDAIPYHRDDRGNRRKRMLACVKMLKDAGGQGTPLFNQLETRVTIENEASIFRKILQNRSMSDPTRFGDGHSLVNRFMMNDLYHALNQMPVLSETGRKTITELAINSKDHNVFKRMIEYLGKTRGNDGVELAKGIIKEFVQGFAANQDPEKNDKLRECVYQALKMGDKTLFDSIIALRAEDLKKCGILTAEGKLNADHKDVKGDREKFTKKASFKETVLSAFDTLSKGEFVNDRIGQTLLHYAAMGGNAALIKHVAVDMNTSAIPGISPFDRSDASLINKVTPRDIIAANPVLAAELDVLYGNTEFLAHARENARNGKILEQGMSFITQKFMNLFATESEKSSQRVAKKVAVIAEKKPSLYKQIKRGLVKTPEGKDLEVSNCKIALNNLRESVKSSPENLAKLNAALVKMGFKHPTDIFGRDQSILGIKYPIEFHKDQINILMAADPYKGNTERFLDALASKMNEERFLDQHPHFNPLLIYRHLAYKNDELEAALTGVKHVGIVTTIQNAYNKVKEDFTPAVETAKKIITEGNFRELTDKIISAAMMVDFGAEKLAIFKKLAEKANPEQLENLTTAFSSRGEAGKVFARELVAGMVTDLGNKAEPLTMEETKRLERSILLAAALGDTVTMDKAIEVIKEKNPGYNLYELTGRKGACLLHYAQRESAMTRMVAFELLQADGKKYQVHSSARLEALKKEKASSSVGGSFEFTGGGFGPKRHHVQRWKDLDKEIELIERRLKAANDPELLADHGGKVAKALLKDREIAMITDLMNGINPNTEAGTLDTVVNNQHHADIGDRAAIVTKPVSMVWDLAKYAASSVFGEVDQAGEARKYVTLGIETGVKKLIEAAIYVGSAAVSCTSTEANKPVQLNDAGMKKYQEGIQASFVALVKELKPEDSVADIRDKLLANVKDQKTRIVLTSFFDDAISDPAVKNLPAAEIQSTLIKGFAIAAGVDPVVLSVVAQTPEALLAVAKQQIAQLPVVEVLAQAQVHDVVIGDKHIIIPHLPFKLLSGNTESHNVPNAKQKAAEQSVHDV